MPNGTVFIHSPANDASLDENLERSYSFVIELIDGDQEHGSLIERYSNAKLLISVSTITAYRCALARILAKSLAQRLTIDGSVLEDIEIAVQEAVSNAVLHGNLDLPTLCATDPSALEWRVHEIEARLGDPRFARRRVTVACDWDKAAILVAVADEGQGFHEAAPASEESIRGGGRGLRMIRRLANAVTYDFDRRQIQMRFPVQPVEAGS